MSGVKLDLRSDANILAIRSPRKRVGGPYAVVYKHIRERWALVALHWKDESGMSKPTLGIRWFHSTKGNPTSNGHPTWCILPNGLIRSILLGLPLSYKLRDLLDEFLLGKIDGEALRVRAGESAKE